MELVRFAAAPAYTAPNHDGVEARRLQGGEASGADIALVGHSLIPDGVVMPMEAAPIGKIYIVTEGIVTIEQADGRQHLLHRLDSIFIPADEARAVLNQSGAPAAMIVVTPTVGFPSR